MKNTVSIMNVCGNIAEAINKGVESIGGLSLKKGSDVVIKPNICNPKNPYGMVLTDFRLIEAVISLVKPISDKVTIVESDNISGSAEKRLIESGLMRRIEEMNVQFLNLSTDDFETHRIAGEEIRLPRTVLTADYFINLPKLKTEGHTLVTLSMKNLFGVLQTAKKSRLHGKLNEILPYLAKTIRNDLIVVDGMTAMEGNGPLIGTPRDLGLLVLGRNLVAVDSICSRMMGLDPSKISHIAKAHEIGLGNIAPDGVDLLGDFSECPSFEFDMPYSLKSSVKSLRSIGKFYLSV